MRWRHEIEESARGDAVDEHQEYHYAGSAGNRGRNRRVHRHSRMPLWQNHAMEMIDRAAREVAERADAAARDRHAVAAWLFLCCALLFALIVVGGVTRLTHSGLSITEWQPIIGTLPPLTDSQWQDALAKYQLTPEYRQGNSAMTLGEFKGIFWWEYFHRLLGRVIGLAFLLPLI